MARSQDGIFVAKETFVCVIDGAQEVCHRGVTRVRQGHPLLARYGDYFEPVDSGVHFDVEQATAAPGEKRGAPRTGARVA